MHIEEIIDSELESLDYRATQFMNTVQTTLSDIRNGDRVVLRLSKNDQYRMLTLKVWMERYRLPLRYILQILMQWTETFARKHFQKFRNTEGLGVKVSTLCGKRSQEILERQIQQDFPNGEHKLQFIQMEQHRILEWEVRRRQKQDDDGIHTSSEIAKSLIDFDQPRFFVRHYRRRITKEHRTREHIIQEMRQRNYRGNPWREETI